MAEFRYIGLAALQARALGAVENATRQVAEDFVARAQDETPVETGTLKASIHVADVTTTATSVTATVATGGESSAYAIIVHEGHRADGSYARKAGPAKFIERPLLREAPVYREFLARAARSAF